MTSENVAEWEAVEPATAPSAKVVDNQLSAELVSRAQAQGLQLIGESGLLQQGKDTKSMRESVCCRSRAS